MKANEWIKLNGWDEAQRVYSLGSKLQSTYFDTKKNEFFSGTPVRDGIDVIRKFFLLDLKHLIESYKLVEKVGGLEIAKDFCRDFECIHIGLELISCKSLIKSVKDVESCM